jgi:hypothetical protein
MNAACEENLIACQLGHACHGLGSPALDWPLFREERMKETLN